MTTTTACSLASTQPHTVDLPLREPISGISKVFGGIFGFLWIANALALSESKKRYLEVKLLDPEAPGTADKVSQATRRYVLDGIGLAGASCWFLQWSHSVKVISLGAAFSYVAGVGYASMGISAADRAFVAAQQFALFNSKEMSNENFHQRNLAFVKIIYNTISVAWSVLGIAPLVAGVAVSPAVALNLLLAGLVFAIFGYHYEKWILEQELSRGK